MFLLVLFTFCLALVFRYWFRFEFINFLTVEEADGLIQAKFIHEGRLPIFILGQHYNGDIDAYIYALGLKFLDPLPLVFYTSVFLSSLIPVLGFLAGKDFFSSITGGVLLLIPNFVLLRNTLYEPLYSLLAIFMLLVVLLRNFKPFLVGFVFGIGVFNHAICLLILPYIRKHLKSLRFYAGFFLPLLPAILYNIHYGPITLTTLITYASKTHFSFKYFLENIFVLRYDPLDILRIIGGCAIIFSAIFGTRFRLPVLVLLPLAFSYNQRYAMPFLIFLNLLAADGLKRLRFLRFLIIALAIAGNIATLVPRKCDETNYKLVWVSRHKAPCRTDMLDFFCLVGFLKGAGANKGIADLYIAYILDALEYPELKFFPVSSYGREWVHNIGIDWGENPVHVHFEEPHMHDPKGELEKRVKGVVEYKHLNICGFEVFKDFSKPVTFAYPTFKRSIIKNDLKTIVRNIFGW